MTYDVSVHIFVSFSSGAPFKLEACPVEHEILWFLCSVHRGKLLWTPQFKLRNF